MKARAATALARVGEPEDIALFREIIRADIKRRRMGLAARLRGDHGPAANGAVMSYSNWHVTAVLGLPSEEADLLLLELLQEQEYEHDTARGLLQRAHLPSGRREQEFPLKPSDYAYIWAAREGPQPAEFDERRRRRFAEALRDRISTIIEKGKESDDAAPFNFRAKRLATILAMFHSRDSSDFILEVMGTPSKWNEWDRVAALQALLFGGAQLGAQQALGVLLPVIEVTARFHDRQHRHLLKRCLCILAFLDEPSIGIAKIRDVLAEARLHGFELRELIAALGQSRCSDALRLLLDMGRASGTALQGTAVEWINAVASLGTAEAKQVLLSFADPNIPNSGVQHRFDHHELEALASCIADIARAEAVIKEGLHSLCARDLDREKRLLLARVIALLGTEESLIAGLNLINDRRNPPVPFELARALEALFLEHRPYDQSGHTYTLEPRNAGAVRRRLFQMFLHDETRRRAAWSLLGEIEVWRLEYGRPTNEPRHPDFDSGFSWPPNASARPGNVSRP